MVNMRPCFQLLFFPDSLIRDITFKAITGKTQGIAFKIIPPTNAKKIARKKLKPWDLFTSINDTLSMLLPIWKNSFFSLLFNSKTPETKFISSRN